METQSQLNTQGTGQKRNNSNLVLKILNDKLELNGPSTTGQAQSDSSKTQNLVKSPNVVGKKHTSLILEETNEEDEEEDPNQLAQGKLNNQMKAKSNKEIVTT